MAYIIRNTEVRLKNLGTLQEPHLFAITSGQNNYASLLFHCKIEDRFLSFAELIPSFEAEIDHSDLELDKTVPNFDDTIFL